MIVRSRVAWWLLFHLPGSRPKADAQQNKIYREALSEILTLVDAHSPVAQVAICAMNEAGRNDR